MDPQGTTTRPGASGLGLAARPPAAPPADPGVPAAPETLTTHPGVPGQAAATGQAGRRPVRPRPAPRPTPVLSQEHAHLSLEALRAYRASLQAEESKVSYWRRILQARLDVVRDGRTGGGTGSLDPSALRPVLTDARVGAGRTALVQVLPVDDIPPLPNLAELWERRVDPGDTAGQEDLEHDLQVAETQLSAYRAALHRRLADATGELIARYRAEPGLCLSALPLPRERRVAGL